MGRRRGISRRTAVAGVVVLIQLAMCIAVAVAPLDGVPHRAPVGIVAPPIVATALADQANHLEGGPLDAKAVTSADVARSDVQNGRSVAVLLVDLRLNTAVLLVSSAQGDVLTSAVVAAVRSLAKPFAATITTRDVAPMPPGSAGRSGLLAAVCAAVVAGLLIAVVMTWRRGPVADTWQESWFRVLVATGASVPVSGVIAALASQQVGGGLVGWWVVAAMTMTATCATTMALEGLLGVAGIGVATTALVVTAAPLIRQNNSLLLPTPWSEVTPWLPHGAALDAAGQLAWFDGWGAVQPLVVLVAWILVSLVVLAISRRERRRAGVVWQT